VTAVVVAAVWALAVVGLVTLLGVAAWAGARWPRRRQAGDLTVPWRCYECGARYRTPQEYEACRARHRRLRETLHTGG